jgi:hypothetical protein
MSEEFQKIGRYAATSIKGFKVEVNYARGVKYVDDEGEIQIESELLVEPYRIHLYPPRQDPAAMERFERILPNLTRALDYLEVRFELW